MGLGNGNAKAGDKGSNHSYEHRSLLTLSAISGSLGAAATEATLQLLLAAVNNGSEFEARLVEDSDSPAVTWLEVRVWNTAIGTFDPPVYYPPNSIVAGAPVLPVVYINNSSVLATIASNTTAATGVVTSLTRVTGAGPGSVAAGKRTISFFNAGAADTNVNGAVLEAGEIVTYPELSNRDSYAAISYDSLTSELLISTVG